MTKKNEAKYDASSVQVLDAVSHIRKRPGMYISGANQDGLRIVLKEILDNSLDEALAGHAETITLILDDDARGATVIDDGRGIPLDRHPKTKLSTLATVFAVANSGAKFDSEAYNTSVGLHGIGATASNACSETFECWSYRGRQQGYVQFKRGKLVGKDAAVEKNTSGQKHGTKVHLRPDFDEIFKDVPPYNPDEIKARLEDVALLLPGVEIRFGANTAAELEVFNNEAGLSGLLTKYAGNELVFPPLVQTVEFQILDPGPLADGMTNTRKVIAEIAIGWRADPNLDAVFRSYVNLSHNPDGGTHQAGLEKALVSYFCGRANDKCSNREILDGLVALIHVKHPAPQFSSQTKEKLINRDLTKQIQEALEPVFKRWARAHATEVDSWLENCVARYTRRQEERDLKGALKELKTTKRKGVLPAKLYEANCRPDQRELYIVEGDSAKGSVVKARDAAYQEVLPVKGKILNVLQAPMVQALENKEVADIVAAIGGGVGAGFSLDKSRVRNKVVLLMDGDEDGSHICSLMLALLCTLMRPLVEAGLVYSVDAPLFVAALPGTRTRFYAHSMDELKQKAGKTFAKCEITRLKGHGEANPEEVAEYAMNPASRKLIQVRFGPEDFRQLELLMSQDVGARKELLGL